MKRVLITIAAMLMSWSLFADNWTDPKTGIEWAYYINGGEATVGSESWDRAISESTQGAITIPSTLGGMPVTSIGECAFEGCSDLTSVTIPSGVTNIGARAFYDCSGLKSVTIPLGVTNIDMMAFYGCSGLKSVTIPSSVTSIGSIAFQGCSGLTSVTIPSSVTNIDNYAFICCSGLKSFNVDSQNQYYKSVNGLLLTKDGTELIAGINGDVVIPSSVTSIGDSVFEGCSNLTSVTIPSSVTSIGYGAFSDCSGLTSMTIPLGVTSIDEGAFSGCSGLKSVTIPSSVTSIGGCAFQYCSELKSFKVDSQNPCVQSVNDLLLTKDGRVLIFGVNGDVVIPSSVTIILDSAFQGYNNLTSVTIPSSVTSIGYDVFYGCEKLKKIYVDEEGDEDRVRGMLEDFGFDTTGVQFLVKGFEAIAGAKVVLDVGIIGYDTAKGLPTGLKYDGKKGMVTGTTKLVGEYEVTLTKRNGSNEESFVLVVRAENEPEIDSGEFEGGSYMVGVGGAAVAGIPLGIDAESGVKSLAAKNLPSGMKLAQDKTTKEWSITGYPTKAGVFKTELTLTTVAGTKVVKTVEVTVEVLPFAASGTFNGFVTRDGVNVGTLQFTATEAGKLTAKVTTTGGSYSLSAACWSATEGDVFRAAFATKKGDTLELSLDTSLGWNKNQLNGSFAAAGKEPLGAYAQKNAFGKTWYFAAEGSAADGWTLSYTENAKAAALTVTLNADGKTSIAGTLGGIKVSASGYANVCAMDEGCLMCDFVSIVSIKEGKSTIKKALSIRTDLWFDRSNDHYEIGAASLEEFF